MGTRVAVGAVHEYYLREGARASGICYISAVQHCTELSLMGNCPLFENWQGLKYQLVCPKSYG